MKREVAFTTPLGERKGMDARREYSEPVAGPSCGSKALPATIVAASEAPLLGARSRRPLHRGQTSGGGAALYYDQIAESLRTNVTATFIANRAEGAGSSQRRKKTLALSPS